MIENSKDMPRPKRSERSTLTVKEEAELRNDALLSEAAAVFVEKGYAQTTTAEIARRAKASKQTFYTRYPRKEDLFLAVLDREIRHVFADLSLQDTAKRSVRSTLQAFAVVLVETMLAPRQIELLRIIAAESKQFPDAAEMFYKAGPRRVTQQLASYFKTQDEQGRLNAPDAEAAAEHFFELTTGAMVRRALLGQCVDPGASENKRRVQQGLKVFLLAYHPVQQTSSEWPVPERYR